MTGSRAPWPTPRSLRVFLLVSAAVHAAVIVALPGRTPRLDSPAIDVLEVTVLPRDPLPAAAPQYDVPRFREARIESDPQPAKRAAQRSEGIAPPQDGEMAGALAAASPSMAPDHPISEAPPTVPAILPSVGASYLGNPAPQYPQAARRAGEHGIVRLRVLVLRDGLPSQVEIEKSSGSKLLDVAARDAVGAWRFAPARHGADPVESWVVIPVVFRLEGAS